MLNLVVCKTLTPASRFQIECVADLAIIIE